MLVFRQLFDPTSSTYTYLLGDSISGEAVLIDPVFEQVRRDAALIAELGLKLLWTLETHVHADHVTGAWLLKQRLGSRIALAAAGGAKGADRLLQDGERVSFGKRLLEVRATPGHTNGCLTYVLDDESMAFTGDCVLIRGSGRTDFQEGDARTLYRSVRARIFSLPDSCLLYPGHDYRGLTVTSVGEEKKYNPRLGGEIGEGDCVGYMKNLNLPHPKKIDEAVPANLRCGQPVAGAEASLGAEPGWAPLRFTFSGLWEVEPHWLEENLGKVCVLDVREPDEFTGPLGHIRGAMLVPLGELAQRAAELPRDKPIVAVCRAGSRSAHATAILQKAGFSDVANLPGGMLRWRGEGRSVEGGAL
ncbi:Glyoxylase, beta-lactamase superfamily II [Enhydrobacter aerosaccus]|uniref:Glyoxylase, beta-lactamase superfamily II n=1 Tax=Enhydrobacter aerosaccus TaxID=225324 RepID=A0A1T4RIG8_9HYPH|nr:MBL fold metallo-hydrolase [Enhydrobacter aerosaccus]SKA15719.1 Glyoxylase, beta-lactamase superfamily II [Enhydrobacter aerosaccus]